MVRFVPISDEDSVISCGISEWNWNAGTGKYSDPSEPTSRLVEGKGWEVIEASDLVFHLQNVCVVGSRWNWTCCSVHSINIRISPVLYSIPDFANVSTITTTNINEGICTNYTNICKIYTHLIYKNTTTRFC